MDKSNERLRPKCLCVCGDREATCPAYVFGDASSSREWVIKGNMNSDKFIDVSLASSI